jgi:hypothetical protein
MGYNEGLGLNSWQLLSYITLSKNFANNMMVNYLKYLVFLTEGNSIPIKSAKFVQDSDKNCIFPQPHPAATMMNEPQGMR